MRKGILRAVIKNIKNISHKWKKTRREHQQLHNRLRKTFLLTNEDFIKKKK